MKTTNRNVSRLILPQIIGDFPRSDTPKDPVFAKLLAGLRARKLVREKEG